MRAQFGARMLLRTDVTSAGGGWGWPDLKTVKASQGWSRLRRDIDEGDWRSRPIKVDQLSKTGRVNRLGNGGGGLSSGLARVVGGEPRMAQSKLIKANQGNLRAGARWERSIPGRDAVSLRRAAVASAKSRLIKPIQGESKCRTGANVAPRRAGLGRCPGLESPGYRRGIAPRWVQAVRRVWPANPSRLIKLNQSSSRDGARCGVSMRDAVTQRRPTVPSAQSRLIKVDQSAGRGQTSLRDGRAWGGVRGLKSPGYRRGIAPRWVQAARRFWPPNPSRLIKVDQGKSKYLGCGGTEVGERPRTEGTSAEGKRRRYALPTSFWEANERVESALYKYSPCIGLWRSSAREPAEVGGPSTAPMLPCSAQDDRFFGAGALFQTPQKGVGDTSDWRFGDAVTVASYGLSMPPGGRHGSCVEIRSTPRMSPRKSE